MHVVAFSRTALLDENSQGKQAQTMCGYTASCIYIVTLTYLIATAMRLGQPLTNK